MLDQSDAEGGKVFNFVLTNDDHSFVAPSTASFPWASVLIPPFDDSSEQANAAYAGNSVALVNQPLNKREIQFKAFAQFRK